MKVVIRHCGSLQKVHRCPKCEGFILPEASVRSTHFMAFPIFRFSYLMFGVTVEERLRRLLLCVQTEHEANFISARVA